MHKEVFKFLQEIPLKLYRDQKGYKVWINSSIYKQERDKGRKIYRTHYHEPGKKCDYCDKKIIREERKKTKERICYKHSKKHPHGFKYTASYKYDDEIDENIDNRKSNKCFLFFNEMLKGLSLLKSKPKIPICCSVGSK